ncbi:hypothetical protein ACFQD0_17940 [Sulfitobacter aestuariivivens]
MLIEKQKLHEQLADSVNADVQHVHLLLAQAKLSNSFLIRPAGYGFIEKELRFEFDKHWYFSAVLHKPWVLWYFRRPALTGLGKDPEELTQVFLNSELTNQQEVKIRIRSLETAFAVLGWVQQNA